MYLDDKSLQPSVMYQPSLLGPFVCYEENEVLWIWDHIYTTLFSSKLRIAFKEGSLLCKNKRSERSERSEVKGIKNRHKKNSPARIWMGVHVSVCLSVCLSVRIKKLNNFWWNERILIKFSGPVQLLASNFWAGESDQPAQRLQPWAKNGLFLENLSPPWVFVIQACDIPFWKP